MVASCDMAAGFRGLPPFYCPINPFYPGQLCFCLNPAGIIPLTGDGWSDNASYRGKDEGTRAVRVQFNARVSCPHVLERRTTIAHGGTPAHCQRKG